VTPDAAGASGSGGDLYSTREVAARLGVVEQRVRQLARRLGVGQRVGPVWVFTPADLARLQARNRRPGRPVGWSPRRVDPDGARRRAP
jgi:hypothetical protein